MRWFRDINSTATNALFRNSVISGLRLRDGWQLAYGAGTGVTFNVSRRFGIELGLRLTRSKNTEWFAQPSIGATYRFR